MKLSMMIKYIDIKKKKNITRKKGTKYMNMTDDLSCGKNGSRRFSLLERADIEGKMMLKNNCL